MSLTFVSIPKPGMIDPLVISLYTGAGTGFRAPQHLNTTMANIASARKRARQANKNREHNMRLRARLRTHIKKVIKAVAEENRNRALIAYEETVPLLDSSVNKNLIHRNKAARHKSRLNRLIRTI